MLESLDGIMAISQAPDGERMSEAFTRFQTSSATRFVPASGIQRQYEKFDDGMFRSARTFSDGWLKASVGAKKIPPRLDTLFGRPIQMPLGERLIGWKGGPSLATKVDKELARLDFELRPPRRTLMQVKLNQVQYNRYLELRGHEIRRGGLTLEERITQMIEDDRWETIPDARKVELIKKTITPYSGAARLALLRENDNFKYKAAKAENRETFHRQGRTTEEADADTLRWAQEIGLQP